MITFTNKLVAKSLAIKKKFLIKIHFYKNQPYIIPLNDKFRELVVYTKSINPPCRGSPPRGPGCV